MTRTSRFPVTGPARPARLTRRQLAAGAALLVLSSASMAAAQDVIKIGAIFPFTGAASTFGNQNFQGVDIAADLVNDRGGINGMKVELVKGDANSTQAAASEVSRLISVEGIEIFLGSSISSVAMVASQEAERNGAFYPPGVLTGVTADSDAYHQELFGPVAMVFKVKDEAEAGANA